MKKTLTLFLILLFSTNLRAQNVGSVGTYSSVPGTCSVGTLTYQSGPPAGLYYCTSADTWVLIATTTIVLSGTDINSSYQVTATHLASALPTNQGGTGNVNGTIGSLTTARTINGISFDGSANITVTAAGSTLSDTVPVSKGGTSITTAVQKTFFSGPTSGADAAPAFRTIAVADVPTLNQTTTGTAASWTTARNLAGNSVDGTANVAFANKFIVQGTSDSGLSAAQFLGSLGTGIVKNTTTTGALSIAVAGDFPTLNQSTTGSAATLTTTRAIYGNNFDGSAALSQVIASTYGGTGNGFTKFTGPTTSEKTFTLPDASSVILTNNAAVTVPQGGTGLGTLTAHALYAGNGSSAPSALSVCGTGTYIRGASGADPICSTLVLPNAASTGNYLISSASNVYVSITPAMTMSTPGNQTGNATSTFKMNGLACAITPIATGRVTFTIMGSIGNNTTADSVTWKLAYGTGTAPSNSAALTGTILGATGVFKALTGQLDAPFVISGIATGLALSTAVWFDLQIADITGGTVTATAVTCLAVEQ